MASRIDPRLQYPSASHYPPPPPPDHHAPDHSQPVSYHYPAHQPTASPHSRPLPRVNPPPPPPAAAAAPAQSLHEPSVQSHYQPQPYYQAPAKHAHPSPAQPVDSPYHSHRHGPEDSPMDGAYSDPNDPKRARACESCRGLKVRCDRDPNSKDQPCLRCAKAKRPCVVTEPSRKRQKKTDSRVADLERKIERLSALLPAHVQDLESPSNAEQHDDDTASDAALSPASSRLVKKRRTDSPPREPARPAAQPSDRRESAGVRLERKWSASAESADKKPRALPPSSGRSERSVSSYVGRRVREIVDDTAAAQMFEHYVLDMAVHMPAIVFPPGTRADDVRVAKPLLFLSILVASSVGTAPTPIQDELHALLLSALADSVIGNVEKRLDVVQALLVATIWYRPPRRYEQMNFYQLAHSAAVMAIDLGLGKRSNPSRVQPQTSYAGPHAASNSIEGRRTWLGCYFQCATISMCLRRPPLIRWSQYMDESIELLETSKESCRSDRLLCQHVRLQHINEQIGGRFSMDDESAPINIVDPKIQDALRGFETELAEWKRGAPAPVWNSASPGPARESGSDATAAAALEISERVTSLYMHEIALHIGHNVDDFRAPFTEEMLKAGAGQGLVLSPAHSRALLDCLRAVHGIFDVFFAFDLAVVRSLPIFFFVRVGYAVVVLVRLQFAVMAPESEISKLISPEDVAAEQYLGRLLRIFQTVRDQDSFRPANKFLVIVTRLCNWFREGKPKADDARQPPPPPPPPPQLDLRASTPLDLLSQVATANADKPQALSQQQQQQQQQQMGMQYAPPGGTGWYGGAVGGNGDAGSGELGIGLGFDQAIDLTLSGVMDESTDLSWLFMDQGQGFAGAAAGGVHDGNVWQG